MKHSRTDEVKVKALACMGRHLRSYLDANERSASWLARRAGVSKNQTCRLRDGICEPGIVTFVRLCQAMGANPSKVLDDIVRTASNAEAKQAA